MELQNKNNMNFNSQICTTRKQSERLLALGLKKETADMCYKVITHDFKGNEIKKKDRDYVLCCWYDESSQVCGLEQKKTIPAWSLHRLCELAYIKSIILDSSDEIAVLYDEVITKIEQEIKEGYFNKEYLV